MTFFYILYSTYFIRKYILILHNYVFFDSASPRTLIQSPKYFSIPSAFQSLCNSQVQVHIISHSDYCNSLEIVFQHLL